MTSRAKWGNLLVSAVVAAAAMSLNPGVAEAQWGGGFGWGFGGFSQVPKPESFLNQQALVAAGRGMQVPHSREIYANNPNSYINHIRDNGLVERYDVARRSPSTYRRSHRPADLASPGSVSTSPPLPAAPQMPTLPLASFYNADHVLVWPADAPTSGDLQAKRATFDQASKAVLAETDKSGVASIATVTDARQKLVEYGRPGLHYIRAHDTARVADTFHLFLLSLYESLAQAVNPPATAALPATPRAS